MLATINPPGFVKHQQAKSFALPEKGDSNQSLEAEQIDVININDFAFVSLTSVGLSVAGTFYISVVMGVLISRLSQMEEPPPRAERDW